MTDAGASQILFVLMGVAGSGKSTVGRAVAERFSLTFVEADDFHPHANRQKMSAGVALTDEDRRPWVAALIQALARIGTSPIILACSALTPSVRAWLEAGFGGEVRYVLLSGDRELIARRLSARRGHFVGVELVESQFQALSRPADVVCVDIDQPFGRVVSDVAACVAQAQKH